MTLIDYKLRQDDRFCVLQKKKENFWKRKIVYCNALQTSFLLDDYFRLFSKKLSSYILFWVNNNIYSHHDIAEILLKLVLNTN